MRTASFSKISMVHKVTIENLQMELLYHTYDVYQVSMYHHLGQHRLLFQPVPPSLLRAVDLIKWQAEYT